MHYLDFIFNADFSTTAQQRGDDRVALRTTTRSSGEPEKANQNRKLIIYLKQQRIKQYEKNIVGLGNANHDK